MTPPSSSTSSNLRRTPSRTLPTRKSKAATKTSLTIAPSETSGATAASSPGIESRQESKAHDDANDDDVMERVPSPTKEARDDDDKLKQKHDDTNNNNNNQPTSTTTTKELQPAFNLQDIGTLDTTTHPHHPSRRNSSSPSRHNSSPSPQNRRRSPSPSSSYNGSAVSRRGRSRSPVGLVPHHPSNSRSNSRTGGGSSRPTSRAGSAGRTSVSTFQVGNVGELSSAALAAGEAAALQPLPYKHHADNVPPTTRNRSPSPSVSRFPSASMSFEMSPQREFIIPFTSLYKCYLQL